MGLTHGKDNGLISFVAMRGVRVNVPIDAAYAVSVWSRAWQTGELCETAGHV